MNILFLFLLQICHATYVRRTVPLATLVFCMVEFKLCFCMPYFSGVQLSITCLKYMEVVNMNVLLLFSDNFSD